MSGSIKDFAALKSLRATIKAQEEARKAAEEERQRREKESRRDAELFRRSIGDVQPLSPSGKAEANVERPLPIPKQRMADEQAALEESLSDEFNVDTLLDTDHELSYARPGISGDILRKLRRGHWVIQAQLDLHGMRRDEAREALGEFLRNAVKRGVRCVRVIHGKGLGSVNKEPVLKSKVRSWLVQKDEVIAFCQARAADGGAGALVVLLKA
ncbi:Smr/MutS family protein [Noviherbaspirillum denitrificans]|uniref:DNA mismatch repair protein MutS n=1 Tax=Noviherbaspirillum denitrificans TaxID=1968433 RepID=A0A254TP20_9BURK|nr:Smr/MutS family protein [Noviherbaspirillum denitrificans]OWW22363.1 DNA mismatch repair protein MutS [Noviherbaspirillum denitrificans]